MVRVQYSVCMRMMICNRWPIYYKKMKIKKHARDAQGQQLHNSLMAVCNILPDSYHSCTSSVIANYVHIGLF